MHHLLKHRKATCNTGEKRRLTKKKLTFKNRNTGPVAYLGPGIMLQPKFGSILTGGSGEDF